MSSLNYVNSRPNYPIKFGAEVQSLERFFSERGLIKKIDKIVKIESFNIALDAMIECAENLYQENEKIQKFLNDKDKVISFIKESAMSKALELGLSLWINEGIDLVIAINEVLTLKFMKLRISEFEDTLWELYCENNTGVKRLREIIQGEESF